MPWSPAELAGLDRVGFMLFILGFHAVAYLRGWLIPGRHHRELLDMRNEELQAAKLIVQKQAETIGIQAQTIAEKNASEAAAEAMIKSFRDYVGAQRESQ